MNQPRISPLLFFGLFTTSFIVNPIPALPSVILRTARQDSWIGLLLGLVLVFICYFLSFMGSLRSSADLVKQIVWLKLGRSVFLLFLILNIILTVRHFLSIVHSNNLPKTPELVLSFTLLLTAGYGAWKGLENLARLALLSFFLDIIAILSIPISILSEVHLSFIFPIFAEPVSDIAYATWQSLGAFLENFFVFTLLPYVKFPSSKRLHLLFVSFSVSALQFLLMFAANFFIFGPFLGGELLFSSLELVKYITFGEFLERIEVILIAVWVIALIFKTSLLLWLCQQESERIFEIKDGRSILLPLVLICSFLTIQVFINVTNFFFFYSHMWVYCVIIGYLSSLFVQFLGRTKH